MNKDQKLDLWDIIEETMRGKSEDLDLLEFAVEPKELKEFLDTKCDDVEMEDYPSRTFIYARKNFGHDSYHNRYEGIGTVKIKIEWAGWRSQPHSKSLVYSYSGVGEEENYVFIKNWAVKEVKV